MSSKKSFERRVENLLRSCGADRYADPRRLVRAIEFGVVGLTGVGVNAVVFVYLVGILNIVAAGFVAFFTSVTWSFGVNRVFTYDRPVGSTVAQYSRYLGVSVGGFVIYLFLLTTLIKLIAIPYLVADLVAVSVGGIWNFLGSEIYAFGFGSSDILFGD